MMLFVLCRTTGQDPIGLVLAPTRELAMQIEQETQKFAMLTNDRYLRSVCLYGGASKHPQIKRIQSGMKNYRVVSPVSLT